MLKMNRQLEYALMVLQAMKDFDGELITVKQASDRIHSPFDVTAKVMQKMNRKGLIHSVQGVSGGYRMARALSQTHLYELMEVILGPSGIVRCARESCDYISDCNVKAPLLNLDLRLKQFYESITLEDLLSSRIHSDKEVKSGMSHPPEVFL